MKYTSAEAAKLLRKLNEEHDALLQREEQAKSFLASVGEEVESVRPAYDYEATQQRLAELEEDIRTVKHAINVFNATHTVEGFDLTIDQMLVYIPQLTRLKAKLAEMAACLPKTREAAYGAGVIDYRYANYDVDRAAADHAQVSDLLAEAQTALDAANSKETMEIDL